MVFLEAHNIISSLGFTSRENFEKIQAGKTGISQSTPELSPEISAVSLVNSDKINACFGRLSNKAADYTRYEKLLICSISDALRSSRIKLQSPETLLIISSTKGNINLREKTYAERYKEERIHLWKSTETVSEFFNHPGRPLTVSNACVSGSLALIIAQRLISGGKYKHAVVAGADILSEFTLSGFQSFKAVSPEASRPFDADRRGMTPGEGAGTLVLTGEEKKAGPKKILLTGGALSNDANHISGPSRTGRELAYAVKQALSESDTSAEEIAYISAHGTATLYNDEMEAKALAVSKLNHKPVNSFKGNIGHTFGAAGIIETILTAESMRQNCLLPSYGYKKQGTTEKVNIIQQSRKAEIFSALKTASGFGGSNAALILKKKSQETNPEKQAELNLSRSVIIDKYSGIIINGKNHSFDFFESEKISKDSESNFKKFSKSLYKELNCKYPKFYKMDKLCKTAFLATELLLKNFDTAQYRPEDLALILSTGSGSAETDSEYQKTIEERANYFPSPKIFVYTLPSIMAGEISIRNNFKGENAVFIEKNFNKSFIFEYSRLLIQSGKAKAVIAGRVNYDSSIPEQYAELYLAEKNAASQ